MRDEIDSQLVELLLCAADLARAGYTSPLLAVRGEGFELSTYVAARYEAMAVAPHVFDYLGDLLADTLLEAAYRVAEGRGVGGVA